MIKNSRQYQITKTQLQKFQKSLQQIVESRSLLPSELSEMQSLEMEALQSQIATLNAELQEYDALMSGQTRVLQATSFEDLPRMLIQARIASGLSQKDLADRLGLKEQQVQRYEATDYESASLARLSDVVRALGLQINKEIRLQSSQLKLSTVWERLKKIGLNREFVLSRLLPSALAARAHDTESDLSREESSVVQSIANTIGPIFGFAPAALIAGDLPPISTQPLQTARFKLPARIRDGAVAAYTVYAHYLALVMLGAASGQRKHAVPNDWKDVRDSILAHNNELSFATVLSYVWDMGVPVLPLFDSGLFHGACWRVDGRNVIVLKQNSRSAARWVIDLLHEFFHAMDYPNESSFSIIEEDEMSEARRNSDDEREATEFAADVMLDGRADELAELCTHMSQGYIPRLKSVVKTVAQQENVSVGVLANYLAFRLSAQGQNWWGPAQNLQEKTEDPWDIARNMLLSRLDFNRLNPLDRELLSRALESAKE